MARPSGRCSTNSRTRGQLPPTSSESLRHRGTSPTDYGCLRLNGASLWASMLASASAISASDGLWQGSAAGGVGYGASSARPWLRNPVPNISIPLCCGKSERLRLLNELCSEIIMAHPKIIVVGGGLAGLSAAIKIAEMGGHVDLFSIVPVKRSHSVCAQGGINAAKNLKGEGDSTWQHFDDTVYGGDFLANQPPVKLMCDMAPGIIDLLDRMGVPFNRTPEGVLDFRRFGGTLYNRTAFAGATTGQQLLYALDEQVRRYEAEGKVTKYEGWEFLSAVIDDKRVCRGICAMDLRGMEVVTFPAEAAIIATGGIGAIFGKSTNSVVCTGSAQSALYQQGAYYANGEFIQVHPTCIPGEDKLRLMSESARGEGGRVWVPR